MKYPIVLTIAGSDSSGGAGIQADIKTISALGGYAASIITALTAQNTQGVRAVLPIPSDFVLAQCEAVFTDMEIAAVKIGMLQDVEIIKAVAKILRTFKPKHVVLDPVMVATSGDTLLEINAIDTLIHELFPLADLITPNLYEAAQLLSITPASILENPKDALSQLHTLGAKACLLKGGHGNDDVATDHLIAAEGTVSFTTKKIITAHTHGTGCTLSAAIATFLAHGMPLRHAVSQAKKYVEGGLENGKTLNIGRGKGPLMHFYGYKAELK